MANYLLWARSASNITLFAKSELMILPQHISHYFNNYVFAAFTPPLHCKIPEEQLSLMNI